MIKGLVAIHFFLKCIFEVNLTTQSVLRQISRHGAPNNTWKRETRLYSKGKLKLADNQPSSPKMAHWNENVVILTKFSSLAALEVVILTTSSAASDENFIKMKTFPFQCITWTVSLREALDTRHADKKPWKPQNQLGNQMVESTPIHYEIDFDTKFQGKTVYLQLFHNLFRLMYLYLSFLDIPGTRGHWNRSVDPEGFSADRITSEPMMS